MAVTTGTMYIDAATTRALELFSTLSDEDSMEVSGSSLYETINKCRTVHGQRLLREWMQSPLCDVESIGKRQLIVGALFRDGCARTNLHGNLLQRVPDLVQISKNFTRGSGTLQDCHRLFGIVKVLPAFVDVFEKLTADDDDIVVDEKETIGEMLIEPLRCAIGSFEKFCSLIESAVDVAHFEETGEYRIQPTFDENLDSLNRELNDILGDMRLHMEKVSQASNVDVIRLETTPALGYHLRVTAKEEPRLRSSGLRMIDATKGSGARFTDSTIDSLNVNYSSIKSQYEHAQMDIVTNVVETAAGYANEALQLSLLMATIDVFVSFAEFAAVSPHRYIMPKLHEKGSGIFEIRQCRHPSLELKEDLYIPNDIVFRCDERLLLITGANMSGKSTYLRSCALTLLLGQMGAMVPADMAAFSVVDGIFARVGSCDYQYRGLSTFMSEMSESAAILKTATDSSFVIIDELGRGTSTFDGSGLAWSIARELADRIGCFSLFATHFHELTMLSTHTSRIGNMRMATSIDGEQLTLLYKATPGAVDDSFGLNVARLVAFPPDVIELARNTLAEWLRDEEDARPDIIESLISAVANKQVNMRQMILNAAII